MLWIAQSVARGAHPWVEGAEVLPLLSWLTRFAHSCPVGCSQKECHMASSLMTL